MGNWTYATITVPDLLIHDADELLRDSTDEEIALDAYLLDVESQPEVLDWAERVADTPAAVVYQVGGKNITPTRMLEWLQAAPWCCPAYAVIDPEDWQTLTISLGPEQRPSEDMPWGERYPREWPRGDVVGFVAYDVTKQRAISIVLDSRQDAEDVAEPWPNETVICEVITPDCVPGTQSNV